jgi:hypothetical protein
MMDICEKITSDDTKPINKLMEKIFLEEFNKIYKFNEISKKEDLKDQEKRRRLENPNFQIPYICFYFKDFKNEFSKYINEFQDLNESMSETTNKDTYKQRLYKIKNEFSEKCEIYKEMSGFLDDFKGFLEDQINYLKNENKDDPLARNQSILEFFKLLFKDFIHYELSDINTFSNEKNIGK